MYKIDLMIKDFAELTLYTNYDSLMKYFSNVNCSIKRTIPITSIKIEEVDKNNIRYMNSVIICNDERKRMYYEKNYNVATLQVGEKELRIQDLTYVLLPMYAKLLQEKDMYLLHSSAIKYDDDNAFVLVGDANAGKTSLAYELISKYGCKLIANDHSIIGVNGDQIKILGGTKEVQMRAGAIEMYFPELYNKINVNTNDIWNTKIVVNDYLDEGLILPSLYDVSNLTDIYSISTSNSGNEFIQKKDSVDELLFLYESFSKIMKGTYNYIVGFSYPMPSIENSDILTRLATNCGKMVDKCDVYYGKGTVQGLAKVLVKKYEK